MGNDRESRRQRLETVFFVAFEDRQLHVLAYTINYSSLAVKAVHESV